MSDARHCCGNVEEAFRDGKRAEGLAVLCEFREQLAFSIRLPIYYLLAEGLNVIFDRRHVAALSREQKSYYCIYHTR